jgi:hypothetical protein
MNVSFLLIGFVVMILLRIRRLSVYEITSTVVVLLLLSVLFVVFAKGPGVIAQISSLLQTAALAGIFAGLWQYGGDSVSGTPGIMRRCIVSALVLMFILFFHNMADLAELIGGSKIDAIIVANPWGLFITAAIVIFALVTRVSMEDRSFRITLQRLVLFFSAIFFLVNMMVMLEVIPGNTSKIREGIGGKGFANLSTNDTGLLAIVLILWNIVFLFHKKKFSWFHAIAIVMNFIMIVNAKSRVTLGLSVILFALYFYYSDVKKSVKIAVILPAIVVVMFVASLIIEQRMENEGIGNVSNPLTELPGSGRPVIWFYYLDAFIYTAGAHSVQWVVGTGIAGLVGLYELTPLGSIGIVLEKTYFYPLHSDLINIFLISGFLGLAAWVLMFLYLFRVKTDQQYRFQSLGAWLVLVIFSSVDMLNYAPLQTLMLILAITSTISSPVNEGIRKPQ